MKAMLGFLKSSKQLFEAVNSVAVGLQAELASYERHKTAEKLASELERLNDNIEAAMEDERHDIAEIADDLVHDPGRPAPDDESDAGRYADELLVSSLEILAEHELSDPDLTAEELVADDLRSAVTAHGVQRILNVIVAAAEDTIEIHERDDCGRRERLAAERLRKLVSHLNDAINILE